MYKIKLNTFGDFVFYIDQNGVCTSFIADPEQPFYQNFKAQINNDEAELEDADGNLMSPDEAKAFVKELP